MARVAVVGAGIVGLSSALALSRQGHYVCLFDRFPLFHERGSSHGRSRIVRRAYPDAEFSAVMAEAYPMWARLEQDAGESLVHECGLVYFGAADSPRVLGVIQGLQQNGVPHEVLRGTRVRQFFPDLQLTQDEIGVWTPEAGWVAADRAMSALVRLAVANGVEVHASSPVDPRRLTTTYEAVVAAVGPWVTDLAKLDVHVSLQTFVDVDAVVPGPVWIDDTELTYGFPSDALGQKIGAHRPGDAFDPNSDARRTNVAHLEQIRRTVIRHFGNAAPLVPRTYTCLYTNTPDERFRIGKFAANGWFVSACSGHAFKMGPWLGEQMARAVAGATEFPGATFQDLT